MNESILSLLNINLQCGKLCTLIYLSEISIAILIMLCLNCNWFNPTWSEWTMALSYHLFENTSEEDEVNESTLCNDDEIRGHNSYAWRFKWRTIYREFGKNNEMWHRMQIGHIKSVMEWTAHARLDNYLCIMVPLRSRKVREYYDMNYGRFCWVSIFVW